MVSRDLHSSPMDLYRSPYKPHDLLLPTSEDVPVSPTPSNSRSRSVSTNLDSVKVEQEEREILQSGSEDESMSPLSTELSSPPSPCQKTVSLTSTSISV